MSIHKKPKTIYINSANRIDFGITTSQDFTVQISSQQITFTPKTAKIVSISIPHVWYAITVENNEFDVNGSTITIPSVNYTAQTLRTELETQIQTVLPGASVTFDSVTKKYTIEDAAPFTLDFSVANSIGPALGFGTAVYAASNSYTSPGVVNLSIDKYMHITSSLISGVDHGVITADGTVTSSNVLLEFAILGNFGDVIYYEPKGDDGIFNIENSAFSETISKSIQPALMDLQFAIVSPTGKTVDMNGHEWEMQIELSPYIYDFKTD